MVITPLNSWLAKYPKDESVEIKKNFFSTGMWPNEAEKDWRMVKVEYAVQSGVKTLFGVVSATLTPHIKLGEILCLKICGIRPPPKYTLTVDAVPVNGTYTMGFMEDKNTPRLAIKGCDLAEGFRRQK